MLVCNMIVEIRLQKKKEICFKHLQWYWSEKETTVLSDKILSQSNWGKNMTYFL